MKKWMFFFVASLFVFAACSNDDEPVAQPQPTKGTVTFEISAVNKLNEGLPSRAPVYSQAAVQHVTRVSIYAFKSDGAKYLFTKSFEVTGWSDGTTYMRYAIPDDEELPVGTYRFLAVGRDATDLFTVTTPVADNTDYETMEATIAKGGDETEIFAGSADATIDTEGVRVRIEMTRKVAGILGFFKNIPATMDGKTVKYLRLTVSDCNINVNLSTGTSNNTAIVPYNIVDIDLSTQTETNGIYGGNDLTGQGVVKAANTQLGGSFYMPIASVTMTLGLYDENNAAIKEWSVMDGANGNVTTLDILANHFYSLGTKGAAGSTDGGTPGDTSDDDSAIDLLIDQNIVITVDPAWSTIHNLTIQ
ncbi:FimB/Mfa2 family fimbrial subunit [Bacteroides sp. UBA939]|uniref:FimB/Mfa2 family fimbrial subunit n=1 Tax=Bacteroides sp. UBA939 TaxID=1946092 RepID=UPI0025C727F8|nr:FimB/Mfa2 family fimbrial subunit [Bacteroides sp. UBA939]